MIQGAIPPGLKFGAAITDRVALSRQNRVTLKVSTPFFYGDALKMPTGLAPHAQCSTQGASNAGQVFVDGFLGESEIVSADILNSGE